MTTRPVEDHLTPGSGAAAARATTPSRRARAALLGAVALAATFLLLELGSFASAGPPRRFNDSNGYLRAAEAPILSRAFLAGGRPPAVPLLYKTLGGHEGAIVRAQSLLSVAGWLGLGLAFASLLRSRAAAAGAAIALPAFSLVVPVNQWDWVLLSESLSLSLFAAAAALSLRLAAVLRRGEAPGVAPIGAWGAACLLFALTRDVNTYLVACGWALLAALTLAAALRRDAGSRRRLGLCLLVLSAALGVAQGLAGASGRWKLPFLNVLLRRVVTEPAVASELAARHGMPRNPVFERYAGRFGWQRAGRGEPMVVRLYFQDDPAVADVRAWILERGVRSYARYLLVDHPVRALRSARRAFAGHAAQAHPNRRYGKGAGSTGWTRRLSAALHPGLPRPPLVLGLLVVAASLIVWRAPAARLPAGAILLLAVTVAAHAFVAFHGDASNVDRHIAYSGIGLRLGLLLLLLTLLDLAVVRLTAARDARPRGAGSVAAA